jgi:hypothetical protein
LDAASNHLISYLVPYMCQRVVMSGYYPKSAGVFVIAGNPGVTGAA